MFFLSILKKFTKLKKEPWGSSFGKIVGLQHPNLLTWDPKLSVFLGVTDIIFWGIFGNSYYMESLQIIDKFCSSHLMIFHDLYIVVSVVIRNWKTFHLLCNFYHQDLHTLCVFTLLSLHKVLIFYILLSSFLTALCCFSIDILKVKFWHLQIKMEDQIWSLEKYRMNIKIF